MVEEKKINYLDNYHILEDNLKILKSSLSKEYMAFIHENQMGMPISKIAEQNKKIFEEYSEAKKNNDSKKIEELNIITQELGRKIRFAEIAVELHAQSVLISVNCMLEEFLKNQIKLLVSQNFTLINEYAKSLEKEKKDKFIFNSHDIFCAKNLLELQFKGLENILRQANNFFGYYNLLKKTF